MANVHGFNDLNHREAPRQAGGAYAGAPIPDSIPFMSKPADRAPLDETIPYTIKIICFPDLKLLSLTILITFVIWVLYILCCCLGINTAKGVLTIDDSVMLRLGAADWQLVRQGEVYRLITASFLHWNLLHIVMNTISLLFLLSRFQKMYVWQSIPILLLSSITGFMLSVICSKNAITAGASVMIFGVLGAYIAYLIINWATLQQYGPIRSQLCCTIGFMVFFALIFSFGAGVDGIGHIGGLIGGLFMSLAVLPGLQQKNKYLTYLGALGLFSMNLTTFLLCYLA